MKTDAASQSKRFGSGEDRVAKKKNKKGSVRDAKTRATVYCTCNGMYYSYNLIRGPLIEEGI